METQLVSLSLALLTWEVGTAAVTWSAVSSEAAVEAAPPGGLQFSPGFALPCVMSDGTGPSPQAGRPQNYSHSLQVAHPVVGCVCLTVGVGGLRWGSRAPVTRWAWPNGRSPAQTSRGPDHGPQASGLVSPREELGHESWVSFLAAKCSDFNNKGSSCS